MNRLAGMAVAILLLLAQPSAFAVEFTSTVSEPSTCSIHYPMIYTNEETPYPQNALPINKTAVTTYANDLIVDYNNLVQAKQENYPNWINIEHFFLLYHPSGQSFNVYVARDNYSTANDQIEFLFATSSEAIPNVYVFTNETSAYLRPQPISGLGFANATYYTYESDCIAGGFRFIHVSTQSPIGVSYFPIIWVTNTTNVYGDPVTGASSAAQALYQYDAHQENLTVNPPFPSQGWWSKELTSVPVDLVILLAAILTILQVTRGIFRLPKRKVEPSSTPPAPGKLENSVHKTTFSPSEIKRMKKRHPELFKEEHSNERK